MRNFIQLFQNPGNEILIFALSVFLGYYIVSRVSSSLHAPLMSLTNAISSIILVVALVGMASVMQEKIQAPFSLFLGAATLCILGINIFGGFMITHRMLAMFFNKPKSGTPQEKK